jgi:hypothetical protein
MWIFHARISAIAAETVVLLLYNQTHALARGSQVGHEIPGIRNVSIVCPPRFGLLSFACAEIHRAPVNTLRPISTIHA